MKRSPGSQPSMCGVRSAFLLAPVFGTLAFGVSTPAFAQITFTPASRNGQNTVVCGAPGAGILINHTFPTFDQTHDPIAVSDPGNDKRPASAAAAQLDAEFTPTIIRLADAGNAQRGSLPTDGNGAYATADGRDGCGFTIGVLTRFRLTASLHAATTEGNSSLQTFYFSGFGIVLDNGSSGGLSHAIFASGDWSATYTGTLSAGTYNIGLTGRTDGGNAYPFVGSFSNTLTLVINYCPADFNGDGFLTGDDFDAYVAAFEMGDNSADFNADGFVTGDDFDLLVAAFEFGC